VRPKNLKKPLIADNLDQRTEWFPIEMVLNWFDALPGNPQKPSEAACKRLARNIQTAINRVGNLEKQKVGRQDLIDEDPNEVFQEKIAPLLDAAGKFITNAPAFENSQETMFFGRTRKAL
jgi:hypothetical protein